MNHWASSNTPGRRRGRAGSAGGCVIPIAGAFLDGFSVTSTIPGQRRGQSSEKLLWKRRRESLTK